MSDLKHMCEQRGRSGCEPCKLFEVDLWDAINHYVIACGGDPAKHVYGNIPRMQCVAEIGRLVSTEPRRLRAALIETRGFLRGVARRSELGRAAKDLLDEADAIDRVLAGKEAWPAP